jgi:hypothetical protein
VRKPHAAGFIGSRWRGEASAAVLYWRDILAVGSIINLFTGFAALMLAAQGVDFLLPPQCISPRCLTTYFWSLHCGERPNAPGSWPGLPWCGWGQSPCCEGSPGGAKATWASNGFDLTACRRFTWTQDAEIDCACDQWQDGEQKTQVFSGTSGSCSGYGPLTMLAQHL